VVANCRVPGESRFHRHLATARCSSLPPRSGTWLARGDCRDGLLYRTAARLQRGAALATREIRQGHAAGSLDRLRRLQSRGL
jgi:hypothetical protein